MPHIHIFYNLKCMERVYMYILLCNRRQMDLFWHYETVLKIRWSILESRVLNLLNCIVLLEGIEKYSTHFIGALEASVDYFTYHIHKILCLLNNMVHFDKCSRLTHGGFFNRKLKGLHQWRYFVHMLRKFFFWLPCGNLKTKIQSMT